MAGLGKRMRPHTLTVPKPLIHIAGKPIVQRLLEGVSTVCDEPVDEIAFVVGEFGETVEKKLVSIANALGAKGTIHYQHQPLGTAHAILCAKEALNHHDVIVAFADTLFSADFTLDKSSDGTIWVHRVEKPEQFGVVLTNDQGKITRFVEKPQQFISDQAIIGIYYFRNGEALKQELQYLIDHDISKGGEYQLTDALQHMIEKGATFTTGAVNEWLDCGNKDATVYTNQRILELTRHEELIATDLILHEALLIPPCQIAEGVVIKNSVVGPHVSVGKNTMISNSLISNSIINENSEIAHANFHNAMVGSHVHYTGVCHDVSIGDYTTFKSE